MKEQARQRIGTLVDRFRTNIDVYKRSAYKEAQVRREFIDPFFEALGWDVSNEQGFAEQYKEVVLEDTIKVGQSTRAPDYSFRIGSQRKFFVEAKKPAVNIKEDVSPSYQLRRYAWSAKLPLSIVTDFEEFSVFNCQMKPNQNDKVGIGRIAYFTFDEYLDKFDAIYDVFSKEAVLKGSFDRYAQSTKGKKGTAEVDSEFLKEIESWRELLAKNIALRNPNVSIYELNYAVQKIIDRIIFLRICEDRGIEPYGQLQTQAESHDVYTHLLNHFRLAESKYDSGIFDFDFGGDGITPGLTIDDRVLKTIIQDLYYPKSPYEFSVLGVEILGNVYEQFLGKVIRLTAGHQAKVETKPEVKKAGGVYYTPQYIVEYIVENTVGKLIAGKTPEELAEIKVLDPACGSGSFLIGAYTYLLRYHLDWYVSNKPKKHKEAVFQAKENEWYLTTAEKKRILLDNIFGVDIDSQAVEVTKLSLLLKVLEHESRESIDQQAKLGLEGVLPNLGDNIKCGNSLIGPEYYELGQQGSLFNEDEMRRVNVFDWDDERKGFGEIMRKGGFDCVVGNPPYLGGREWKKEFGNEYDYFIGKYDVAEYQFDIYVLFWERGIRLLKENGLIGLITPNTWLNNKGNIKLRRFILDNTAVLRITDYSRTRVFPKVVVLSIVTILRRTTHLKGKVEIYISDDKDLKLSHEISQAVWYADKPNIFNINLRDVDVLVRQKIEINTVTLESLAEVKFGIKLYETGKGKPPQKALDARNHIYEANMRLDQSYRPYLEGKDINRYEINWKNRWLKYGQNLAAPRDPTLFEGARLLARRIVGTRLICSFTDSDYVTSQLLQIVKPYNEDQAKYLLGILNSSLIAYYFRKTYNRQDKTFPEIRIYELRSLPIRTIDFSNPAEKTQHDKLVALVENMLEQQKKYHETRMERDKELYERQIKIVDVQIDRLVYDLYGLTEEEVKVVEGE